ncbi:hypothetical protein N9J26_00325 [bacterium]|nr:hypothetical protein [bacterium]
MLKYYGVLLLAAFMALSACEEADNSEALLIGEWLNSSQFSFYRQEDVARVPDGMPLRMVYDGQYDLKSDRTYTSNGTLTIVVKHNQAAVPIVYTYNENGSWYVDDGMFFQTAHKLIMTPMDDRNQALVQESDILQAIINPPMYELSSMEIIALSSSSAQLKVNSNSGSVMTLTRAQSLDPVQ